MKNSNPNSIQKYFAAQREIIDNEFHSVEGNFDADFDTDGGYEEEDYSVEGDFAYADDFNAGGVAKMPARKSQPYIINVQNTGTVDLSDVVIGNAFEALYSASPSYGNNAAIILTSGIPGVSYKQWLSTNAMIPYVVGMTVVTGVCSSDAEANAQAQVVVNLTESLADGNLTQRPLILQKDPYQNQNNIVANHTGYKVDMFLKFTIATIYAGATMQFKFYPTENVSPTRALAGAQALRTFSAPNIVNAQRLQIQQGGNGIVRRPAPIRRTA